MEFFKKNYLLPFVVLFSTLAFFVNQNNLKPNIVISKQEATWNLNNEMVQKFHLGFKRLQSSILWVSTILESDIERYKAKDLNSWMFLRFSTISQLEPRFYENYNFGGIYLSIIKDDLEGATVIYNKGLAEYPDDFKLLRDSSFHFFYEAKNFERAYEISKKIKKLYPEKKFLIGMITKLEAEHGFLEEALLSLNQFQEDHPLGTLIGDKIFENRYALKAEIDLKCLNSPEPKNCSTYDLKKNPYIKTRNGYIAKEKWEPYRRKSLNR